MAVISAEAIKRIVKATRTVEQLSAVNIDQRSSRSAAAPSVPFWGYVKTRVEFQGNGYVNRSKGDCVLPTESTSVVKVANPYGGDLLKGHPVLVVPATIERNTNYHGWYISPMPIVYYAKNRHVMDPHTFDNQVTVYNKFGDDTGEDISEVFYGWPYLDPVPADTKIKIAWNYSHQRFEAELAGGGSGDVCGQLKSMLASAVDPEPQCNKSYVLVLNGIGDETQVVDPDCWECAFEEVVYPCECPQPPYPDPGT